MPHADFWVDANTKRQLQTGTIDVSGLAAIKRSISDFVRILTGKNIPVKFKSEGGQSYTDGNSIVISSDITNDTFDQTVGIALHEASHIVKSNFYIFEDIEHHIPDDLYQKGEDTLKRIHPDKDFDNTDFLKRMVHYLTNYIEDRRIDYWVFTTSPGYRGYYHAMYDAYWHSEEISEKLQSDQFRDESIGSYMTRIINLSNDSTDLTALNGLREIAELIDLNNIERFQNTREVFEVACDCAHVILDNVEDIEFDEQGDVRFVPGEGDGCGNDGEEIDFDDLSEAEKQSLKDAIEKQLDFLDGDIEKESIDSDQQDMLDAIEEAGVDNKPVGEGSGNPSPIDCIVVDQISAGLVDNNNFSILDSRRDRVSEDAVLEGIRLGRMLGRRLKVRDERRETVHTRRKTGKLDGRLLSELTYNERIFHTEEIDEYSQAFIHISVDASGSMGGDKWHEAMSVCVAIAKACSMIDNIRVQISFRSTAGGGYGSRSGQKPLIIMGYDSDKNNFVHIKRFFSHISPGGTTPTGLTFEAIMDKIETMKKDQDGYFVNLSDGRPNFDSSGTYSGGNSFSYRGQTAIRHTRDQIEKIRRHGVKVISYYIDGSGNPTGDNDFEQMYGKDSHFIRLDNIREISQTMNDKFLEK